jgi:hypothetical protein
MLINFRAHAKFKAVLAKWWEFVGNLFDSSWRTVVDVIRHQGIQHFHPRLRTYTYKLLEFLCPTRVLMCFLSVHMHIVLVMAWFTFQLLRHGLHFSFYRTEKYPAEGYSVRKARYCCPALEIK